MTPCELGGDRVRVSIIYLFSVTVPVLDLRLLHRELAGLHGYVLLESACEARVFHVLRRHPWNVVGGAQADDIQRVEVGGEAVLAEDGEELLLAHA